MHTLKMPWSYLPQTIREQALACRGAGRRAVGPGDGRLYHWVAEVPPAGYRGPLPTGRLVRCTKGR